ncbi:MAG: hypothetical protein ACRDTD_19615 [Pseudonocardiaceae bacterium]
MPDTPTSALVLPYHIQHRRHTVPMTTYAEVSLPTGQLLHASGLLSPRNDTLPADTALWRGER